MSYVPTNFTSISEYIRQWLATAGGLVVIEHAFMENRIRAGCVKCKETLTCEPVLDSTMIPHALKEFVQAHNINHRNATWRCEMCGNNLKSSVGLKEHAAACPGGVPLGASTCKQCFGKGGHADGCPLNLKKKWSEAEAANAGQMPLFTGQTKQNPDGYKFDPKEQQAIKAAMEAYEKQVSEAELALKIAQIQTAAKPGGSTFQPIKTKPGAIIHTDSPEDIVFSMEQVNQILKDEEAAAKQKLEIKMLKDKLDMLEKMTPSHTSTTMPKTKVSNLLTTEGRKFR